MRIDSSPTKTLIGISKKQIRNGDRRFALLVQRIKFEINGVEVPDAYRDPFLIEKYGSDPDFGEIGIEIAKIEAEDRKKIIPLIEIIRHNSWLRMRALIGANFRADLAFLMQSKTVQNPNQAAKIMGSSRETAYRLWKDLCLVENLERLLA